MEPVARPSPAGEGASLFLPVPLFALGDPPVCSARDFTPSYPIPPALIPHQGLRAQSLPQLARRVAPPSTAFSGQGGSYEGLESEPGYPTSLSCPRS